MESISKLAAFLVLTASCTSVLSEPVKTETLSSEAVIRACPEKAGGLMYVYDYKAETPMTPAPKGYRPFYISQFGRHGARYALQKQFEMVSAVLGQAESEGLLNERGAALFAAYKPFHERASLCEGELTEVGIDQQRTIATRLYRRFPEVFRGETRLSALATPVPRVIMSMTSFIDALQAEDKTLEVEERSSESFSPILRPNWSTLDVRRPRSVDEIIAPYIPYFKETVDVQGILGRIFTDPDAAVQRCHIDVVLFIRYLFDLDNGMGCLEHPEPVFDGLFTAEDRVAVARAAWYRLALFLTHVRDSGSLYPDFAAYTLRDIMDLAEEDMESGAVQLRLRFSHDSSLIPLAVLMDVNGMGRTAASAEEAFEIFPMWKMPMGGSLQLVFYRSRRNPEVLVKVLWNEAEATLPFPAADGPYYRWSDFKSYYRPVMDRIFTEIETLRTQEHAHD